jgi:hypothetical protein
MELSDVQAVLGALTFVLAIVLGVAGHTCLFENHGAGDVDGVIETVLAGTALFALWFLLPTWLYGLVFALAVVAAVWMCTLDPHRTDKAALASRLGLDVQDARIARAFAELTWTGRKHAESVQQLDDMLQRGRARREKHIKQREEDAMYTK